MNRSAFPIIPPLDAPGYPFPESGMSIREYLFAHAPNLRLELPEKAAEAFLGEPISQYPVGSVNYELEKLNFLIKLDVVVRLSWVDRALKELESENES